MKYTPPYFSRERKELITKKRPKGRVCLIFSNFTLLHFDERFAVFARRTTDRCERAL